MNSRFQPGAMSNHTSPFSRAKSNNLRTSHSVAFDIGDGPLAQSIIALSGSSAFFICLSYLGYYLLTYWILIIPTTLMAVESNSDGLQSLKKSDDRNTMPFDQEEKLLAAFQEATAVRSENLARTTLITSSLRRTIHYWLSAHWKIGGIFHGIHLLLPSVALKWIELQAGLAVSRQLKHIDIEQQLPWYIPVKLAVNAPDAFIGLASCILAIPFTTTWTWHLLSWQTSSFHRRTHWPPLQQLMSRHGIWFLMRQIPLPMLPSKAVLWHMFLPTLVSFVVTKIGSYYPESMNYSLFVKTSSANARPKMLMAAAILVEGTATRCFFYILPRLFRMLLIRVQASLLPEDAQSIVPIDRGFGLKHPQRQRQGITLIEAWKTMSWDSLWRTLKMHLKTWALLWSILVVAEFGIEISRAVVTGAQQHHDQRLQQELMTSQARRMKAQMAAQRAQMAAQRAE